MSVLRPDSMGTLTMEILQQVAAAENIPILELPPLYESIDPECLERLTGPESEVTVEFTYCGYRVRVADGRVVLSDVPEIQTPSKN